MHPLVESDPAERTQSRQETPTAEALAFLADPDAATQPKRKTFAQWLGDRPEWTGPPATANEDDEGPHIDLWSRAYAKYIRETWPERLRK